ncbi:MAG TPA: tetratricopeptide repeat protein [Candidatus Krumholzibacteria bacterium]|nr:tetratricopeptide repeat protein [Candidatus Krumholzibacteria bacterium]
MRSVLVVVVLIVASCPRPVQAWDPLQRAERAAHQAQESFARGDTLGALESMLRAQALAPEDPRIRAGLAETLYDGGEFEAAMRQYAPLADPEAPLPRRLRALYNAGNAAFEQQDYERALQFYTEALVQGDSEPDPDLLHNLELAQRLRDQQEQQSQQSEEQGEDGEPQDGEQPPQDQQQQDSQGEQPPPEDQQQDPQQPERSDDPQQAPPDSTQQQSPPPDPEEAGADSTQMPPPPRPEQMTPEEAMRLLEALDFDEQELRESIQRRLRGDREEDENDW